MTGVVKKMTTIQVFFPIRLEGVCPPPKNWGKAHPPRGHGMILVFKRSSRFLFQTFYLEVFASGSDPPF
jgi:hypothetical protein